METKASISVFVVVVNSVLVRLILLFVILGRKVGGATLYHPEVHRSTDREELIKRWAPVVWLHSEELFYPSSVIDFLQHVKPSTQEGGYLVTVYNNDFKIILPSLPKGRSSWDTYLLASYNTDCRRCALPNYLHGVKPGGLYTPPTYAVIHSCSFPSRNKRNSRQNVAYTESFQDSSIKGYTNSKLFSETHEDLSSSDQNTSSIWRSMPIAFTLAPTLPTYSAPSITHTDESFKQLINNSNHLNTSHEGPSIMHTDESIQQFVNISNHLNTSYERPSITHTDESFKQRVNNSNHLNISHERSSITHTDKSFKQLVNNSNHLNTSHERSSIMHTDKSFKQFANNLNISHEGPSITQTDESFNQLVNNSNDLYISHGKVQKSHPVRQNTQNTTATNLNFDKNPSNQSETKTTTNKQTILLQTAKPDLHHNSTRKTIPNITEVLDSHAVYNQKSHILRTEHKTDLSVDTEIPQQSQMKPKKRHAITHLNQRFSVTYWMFYPYNYGKEMCTANLGFLGRILKPTINSECHGEKIPMGNHIGDWEHITIEFKGQLPTKLYISSHNFGAYYSYDSYNHVFRYTSQDTREGFPLSPEYPRFLQLQENHPVIFAALGSHGLWPTPGTHHYNSLPSLEDKTDFGTQWQTWLNLEVIDFKQQQNFTQFQRQWLYYGGRWGNPSSNCHALMGGFCELNHGPTGIPRKRINFPCS